MSLLRSVIQKNLWIFRTTLYYLQDVILHQSYQYNEVFFLGAEDVSTWDLVTTIFTLIPAIDRGLMIRLASSSRATADQLKSLLLTKFHSELPWTCPTLTHQGKVLTNTVLTRWDKTLR